MNPIQQHIDYLFQDLPPSDGIKQLKIELYLQTMERYQELLSLGKSESEALGTVIMEIGDRDVLLEELGYEREEAAKKYVQNDLEEARLFIASISQESTKIGIGILLILIGSGFIATADTFNLVELGVIILLGFVALAVGLFIDSGLKMKTLHEQFDEEHQDVYMTDADYKIIEKNFFHFKERERYRIPLGVMLCIVAAIPIIFFGAINNELWTIRYGVPLLTISVGIGVFQFVKYGMIYSAYEKILGLNEHSREERQFQRKIEPLSNLYWLVVTMLYLGWSFLTGRWDISWLIWPIAGFAWAFITIVLKMMNSGGKRYN